MKDARKLVLTYDTRSSPLSGTKMKRKKNEREIEYLSTRNARVEEKRKNNGRKDRRSSKVYTRRIGGQGENYTEWKERGAENETIEIKRGEGERERGSSGACTPVQQRRRQEIVLDARRVKLVSSRCAHATRSGRTSFRTSLRCPVVLSVRFSLGLSTCPVRGREIRDASARK